MSVADAVQGFLTIKEAAQVTGCSVDTIKRRVRAGAFPGLVPGLPVGRRSPPWLIPVGDLVAAQLLDSGFVSEVSRPVDGDLATRVAVAESIIRAQQRHISDLNRQLGHLVGLVASLSGATTVNEQERVR